MSSSSDFITDFLALTEGLVSPPIFRLWAAIGCLAGALERDRVFVRSGSGVINPNLYTLLVAPPGVGKFVVETVRQMWEAAKEPGSKLPAFHVMSDSVTNAAMMDELAAAKVIRLRETGPPLTYHSLLVAAEEFEVLIPAYDKQFIASFNSIYNCKDEHKEKRRTGSVKELKIEAPCLNMLGGAQPVYLAHTFPEEAWGTGLIRRVIMIYCGEAPLRDFFYSPGDQSVLRAKLIQQLGRLAFLQAELKWTPQSIKRVSDWHMAGGPPTPKHSKLTNYLRSRSVFVAKLATISAISRGQDHLLELEDVDRAMKWLLEAEALMPDIFREMLGKSDRSVLEELHLYLESLHRKHPKTPIPSESIYAFLSHQVPADKVVKLFDLAEKSAIIQRIGGETDKWKAGVGGRVSKGLE